MASTYSALKIELIGTGEQSGTWGVTTDTNLDVALGEAITGSADVNYSTAADVTLTLIDTNTAQTARNLRLNITESSTGIGYVGNLILGSGCQIEKFYIINNSSTGAKTVKNTTGTGISVPAGKTMVVFNNGTNVVDAITHLSSLTSPSATITTLNSSGGALNGTVGATTPSTGSFTTLASTGGTLNGSIGATTPSTGVFTSLTATSGSLNGITIGALSAAAGTFTTVNATTGGITNLTSTTVGVTTLTASGGTINGTSIGATTPSTGAFTNFTASGTASFTSTGAVKIPAGTTAQQPSPTTGMIRYNSTNAQFEGYGASSWGSLGGGATGGGSNQVFVLNDQTVTVDYTIPTGKNASSAGPITIDTGITVTVPTDSTWVIV